MLERHTSTGKKDKDGGIVFVAGAENCILSSSLPGGIEKSARQGLVWRRAARNRINKVQRSIVFPLRSLA